MTAARTQFQGPFGRNRRERCGQCDDRPGVLNDQTLPPDLAEGSAIARRGEEPWPIPYMPRFGAVTRQELWLALCDVRELAFNGLFLIGKRRRETLRYCFPKSNRCPDEVLATIAVSL
jgi:hypothetical protein